MKNLGDLLKNDHFLEVVNDLRCPNKGIRSPKTRGLDIFGFQGGQCLILNGNDAKQRK